jgi:5'-deoxynucleotidase YfbR-like HD superfamily hydrolase
MTPTAADFKALAALVLRFGQVERLTQHPDGRPETDTTHTVMLALAAVLLAPSIGLDPGKCAIAALVHDLPEAYAGDVPTLKRLTEAQQCAKDLAEASAVRRIRAELPVLGGLIGDYEAQYTPEARMIKVLDKIMPKLTHLHDKCAVPRQQGMPKEALRAVQVLQGASLRRRYPEPLLVPVHDLFDELTELCVAAYPDDR